MTSYANPTQYANTGVPNALSYVELGETAYAQANTAYARANVAAGNTVNGVVISVISGNAANIVCTTAANGQVTIDTVS